MSLEEYRARESDLAHAGQFVTICRGLLRDRTGENWSAIAHQAQATAHALTARAFAEKAAAVGLDAWGEPEGRTLAAAYLSEVAGANLVDALKPYAMPIPRNRRVF